MATVEDSYVVIAHLAAGESYTKPVRTGRQWLRSYVAENGSRGLRVDYFTGDDVAPPDPGESGPITADSTLITADSTSITVDQTAY